MVCILKRISNWFWNTEFEQWKVNKGPFLIRMNENFLTYMKNIEAKTVKVCATIKQALHLISGL